MRGSCWAKGSAADGKTVVNSLNYGAFIGNVIDFVIVAAVVFLILRMVLTPEDRGPPTKMCAFCRGGRADGGDTVPGLHERAWRSRRRAPKTMRGGILVVLSLSVATGCRRAATAASRRRRPLTSA